MKKIVLTFLLSMLFICNNSFSQRSFGSRVFLGGNLGMQFGSVTLIDVSPMIGYRLTESVDLGISLTYKYYNYKDYFYYVQGNKYYDLETNILGGGFFGRYHFTESFFAHAEVEYLNFNYGNYKVYNNGVVKETQNVDVTSIFVGGGIKQAIGRNSFFTLMILYNLNETTYSPYTNPIIRAGFGVGI